MKINTKKINKATKLILEALKEDFDRDGLKETPDRVAKAWKEMMAGYYLDPKEILSKTFDDITVGPDSFVEIKDIPVYSFCEHHLLPFFGTARVKYKPNNKIVGLSKINRLVKAISNKLQTQERITHEIAQHINDCLKPKYIEVELECRHLCVEMRGIKHPNSKTKTIEIIDSKK